MRAPEGFKLVEDVCEGDLLLSSPEDDPAGPVEVRRVEEVFVRTSPVFTLTVRGQLIRTTAEHPFFVQEAAASGGPRRTGWTKACFLQPGDLLRSHDGRWIALDSISSIAQEVTVYNLRVADYHTYFVGSAEWGFSVWSHNTSYDAKVLGKALEADGQQRAAKNLQAAHVVPTGAFSGRKLPVQQAVKKAQAALASAKIGLNTAKNGFWATAGHMKTHTNEYLRKLGKLLGEAAGTGTVAETLESIRLDVIAGRFL